VEGSGGRVPTLHRIPWHLPCNLGKARKTTDTATEWRSAADRRTRFVLSIWQSWAMITTGLVSPAALGFRFRRRGQPSFTLSICRVAILGRFPTSANFESKLSVRALMWSANSGTPKSSRICLLLTCQGASVARQRHLDCNT